MIVPVLSSTTARTRPARSSASLFLNRIPYSAPLVVPTMIAVGVARPSAHGQAMTSTATALIMAPDQSARANTNQPTNVTSAMRDHGRHEIRADPVGQLLDRRLAALRFLHEPHDLRQRRVLADLGRFEADQPLLVDGRADDLVARALCRPASIRR